MCQFKVHPTDIAGGRVSEENVSAGIGDKAVWWTSDRICDENFIGGLRSQLKSSFWNRELEHEMDLELAEFIREGVHHGFRIVDAEADVSEYRCANYKSVLEGESAEFVNDLIILELTQEKYVLADYEPLCVHALGAVRKKSGSFRPITDCKRPLLHSINNYMDTTFQTFKYHSSDSVCELMTPSCYMATVDIASAYRTIPVNPEDWKYQGISWLIENEQRYLYDTRLCFGLRCAPFIFTKIAEFIANCMSRRGHYVVYYIDDFWVSGVDFVSCQQAQIDLIVLLGNLGFSVAWDKCSSPSQTCVYLGLRFDSCTMTIALPDEKLCALHNELSFFRNKKRATKKQLMRLAGILSHCSRVVRGGRTFSRRILNLLKGLNPGNPRIYLNEEFRLDLEWWRSWSYTFNGIRPIQKYNYGDSNYIVSDASQNGYGVTFDLDWLAGYFNTHNFPTDVGSLYHSHHWCNVYLQHDNNINVLELVPILLAARHFGQKWVNTHIVCFTDNTQVASAVNKGVSSNKLSMSILRELFWLSVYYNFYITARYFPGELNVVNDMLSRVSVRNKIMSEYYCSLCCRSYPESIGHGNI